MIKRLRCVVYLDDRIPEEADILDFFNLGGVRRLRSEAFRRLLLSGWMAVNQTQAANRKLADHRQSAEKPFVVPVAGERQKNNDTAEHTAFNGKQNGLSYDKETMNHDGEANNDDFFGKLF
ncbi:MAG: hypothetical protein ACYDB0_02695 [Acidithiobacillus sp.]